jgi:3-methylfumaryl-CoA hydratase
MNALVQTMRRLNSNLPVSPTNVRCLNDLFCLPVIFMNDVIRRMEVCGESAVRRVAAMLDLDPAQCAEGAVLPRGWHFILMGADTKRSDVRQDGFAGLGVPMPDLGLPRLLLAGRSVSWFDDIRIGSVLQRESTVRDIVHKTTSSGPMAVVTVAHDLRVAGAPKAAVEETQTYFLLPQREPGTPGPMYAVAPAVKSENSKRVVPDETMLFQYSALGFNSHKIHIDKAYARDVEGFPDLVVNGGLTTLLMTEFLRHLGISPIATKLKYLAPLFCGRQVSITADRSDAGWHLRAMDVKGVVAVNMEVQVA